MKRILGVLFVTGTLAAMLFLGTVPKRGGSVVYAQFGCGNATLLGNYPFSNTGFTTPTKSVTGEEDPFATVGVLVFDGAGNVSVSYTLAFKGRSPQA